MTAVLGLGGVVAWRVLLAPSAEAQITFNEHIAPIVFENCAPCHRPGESAPFSLLAYEDVKKRAGLIQAVTASRYMPPWLPDARGPALMGARGLTDEQIALIATWVSRGAPEGDARVLPPRPEFTPGWRLGPPDLIVALPAPYELAAEGTDVFRNFVIPVPVSTPKWVRALAFRPEDARLVHHAVVALDRSLASRRRDHQEAGPGFGGMDLGAAENPGGQLIGWTPGKFARADDRLAWRLDPGSDLVVQLHMQPTGKPEAVSFRIGLYFTSEPPRETAFSLLLRNDDIDIAPGDSMYTVEDQLELPVAVEVIGLYPHAHYLGKEMEVFATLPDGSTQWLLHIPSWDFDWQDDYRYVEPVHLPAGAVVTMRYGYDNSASNVRNPNHPPARVRFGNRSADEMATLGIQVVPPTPGDSDVLRAALMRHRLERDPESWLAHSVLGATLSTLGRHEEALGHLREATRLAPYNPGPQYNLGNTLEAMGRYDDAIEAYHRALALEPNHAKAHNNLAVVYQMQGRLDDAIRHYRRQMALSPLDARVHYNLGYAMQVRGRLEMAAASYRRALELDPGLAGALEGLGDVHRLRDEPQLARASYERALALNEASPAAHFGMGLIDLYDGEVAAAREHLARAIDAQSEFIGVLNNEAWRLATDPDPDRRDRPRALAMAEIANELTQHTRPELLDTLGAAYAAGGDFARAVAVAQKALDLAIRGGMDAYVDQFRSRLELYRSGRAYVRGS